MLGTVYGLCTRQSSYGGSWWYLGIAPFSRSCVFRLWNLPGILLYLYLLYGLGYMNAGSLWGRHVSASDVLPCPDLDLDLSQLLSPHLVSPHLVFVHCSLRLFHLASFGPWGSIYTVHSIPLTSTRPFIHTIRPSDFFFVLPDLYTCSLPRFFRPNVTRTASKNFFPSSGWICPGTYVWLVPPLILLTLGWDCFSHHICIARRLHRVRHAAFRISESTGGRWWISDRLWIRIRYLYLVLCGVRFGVIGVRLLHNFQRLISDWPRLPLIFYVASDYLTSVVDYPFDDWRGCYLIYLRLLR